MGAAGTAPPVNADTGTGAAGNVGPVLGGSASPPASVPISNRFNMPGTALNLPLKGKFGPGFQLSSDDDEYQFQFHNLTQVDYRGFQQGGQNPVSNSFSIPRQWFMFSGRITKPFEYYVVPSFQFDDVNLLDAFINIHYDDRFQLKIGRYKTPFTYEFFNLPIKGLITPERSLFFNNFGLNRDLGVMVWGQLFKKRLDYAVGIFNGALNSYLDTNDAKDVASYVNFRPFGGNEDSLLENLNFGGSVDFGNQKGGGRAQRPAARQPHQLHERPLPGLQREHPAERRPGVLGPAHGLLLPAPLPDRRMAERVPGLRPEREHLLPDPRPRRELLRSGRLLPHRRDRDQPWRASSRSIPSTSARGGAGLGAIELTGRYNILNIGNRIFTPGFADPNLWTNQLQTVDVGVNWYPTQYTKVYLGWQHGMFGDPVQFAPGRRQITSDMFWFRFQLYF